MTDYLNVNSSGAASRTSKVVLGLVGLFVVGLLSGAGVAGFTHDRVPAPQPPPPSQSTILPPDPVPIPDPTTDSPSVWTPPPADPSPTPSETGPSKAELEQEALDALNAQADEDLDNTVLSGQWAAQLSSKYIGVVDPKQQTESGSHKFRAVDIWAEHQKLREQFGQQYTVRLLRGEDFGKRKTHQGKTYWYTFVLDDFGSRPEVKDFCALHYPGDVNNNHCLPTDKLKP